MEIQKLFIVKRKKTFLASPSLEGRIFEIVTAVLIVGLLVLVRILGDRADSHPEMAHSFAPVADYIANYKMDLQVCAALGIIASLLLCIGAYFPSAINLFGTDIQPAQYGLVSRMLRIEAIEIVFCSAALMLSLSSCYGFHSAMIATFVLIIITYLTLLCFTVLIDRQG